MVAYGQGSGFDPYPHLIKQIILAFGKILYPEEQDLTVVYEKARQRIGLDPIVTSTSAPVAGTTSNQGATAAVGQDAQRMLNLARSREIDYKCPNSSCTSQKVILMDVCPSCKESEGGQYLSAVECPVCHTREKFRKPMVVWFKELGIDFGTQTKRSLGIRTLTDEGVK
jgi:hypothetical protein